MAGFVEPTAVDTQLTEVWRLTDGGWRLTDGSRRPTDSHSPAGAVRRSERTGGRRLFCFFRPEGPPSGPASGWSTPAPPDAVWDVMQEWNAAPHPSRAAPALCARDATPPWGGQGCGPHRPDPTPQTRLRARGGGVACRGIKGGGGSPRASLE